MPLTAATASSDDGNLPRNTLDGKTNTRWSAQGDGEWIQYDLGAVKNVAFVKIAWSQGNARTSNFDVAISTDGTTWNQVLSGKTSSGTTEGLETYDFADTSGRYVRITGHGNSANDWNSILETEIHAAPDTSPGAFTLTTHAVGGGTVTKSPDQPTYKANSQVTLKAVPNDGQQFTGWSGAVSGTTNPVSVKLTGNATVTANCQAVSGYTLSATASDGGNVTKSPDAPSYASGTQVRLSANPDEGFEFDKWSGSLTGTANPITTTMTQNKTVNATFKVTSGGQVPQLLKDTFSFEGPSGYSADGRSITFDAWNARVVTGHGHGWRHELSVLEGKRHPMNKLNESFQADYKIDLMSNSKAIIAQYHAQDTGTLVKVYVSDHSTEKRAVNKTAGDGVFDVFVRLWPLHAKKGNEKFFSLGTVRSGETFNLSIKNELGYVTVSALGNSTGSQQVENGGQSFFKFGDYLQVDKPNGPPWSKNNFPDNGNWEGLYRSWGISASKITVSNIKYSREVVQ